MSRQVSFVKWTWLLFAFPFFVSAPCGSLFPDCVCSVGSFALSDACLFKHYHFHFDFFLAGSTGLNDGVCDIGAKNQLL